MSLEQRLYDGSRAREVLENEAFGAAFDQIEAEIITQWKQSPARDAEGRERIWQYLTMLQKVKNQLTQTMETGKLAQLELEHQRSILQRMRDGWSSATA